MAKRESLRMRPHFGGEIGGSVVAAAAGSWGFRWVLSLTEASAAAEVSVESLFRGAMAVVNLSSGDSGVVFIFWNIGLDLVMVFLSRHKTNYISPPHQVCQRGIVSFSHSSTKTLQSFLVISIFFGQRLS